MNWTNGNESINEWKNQQEKAHIEQQIPGKKIFTKMDQSLLNNTSPSNWLNYTDREWFD